MKSQQTAITATLQPVDSIGEALNLAPLPTPNSSSSVEVDQVHDDFEYARGNMINTIEKGNEALQ